MPTVDAPESTYAKMLKNTQSYQKILEGDAIPKLNICLVGAGTVPMVTIGDSAFPRHLWPLKSDKEDTRYPQQKYFHKKLCSVCVVTENAYGMLKGRWRILYKQTEYRMYNLKYVIMSCIMLHNLCISVNDACEPRWRPNVKELGLIKKTLFALKTKERLTSTNF